MNTKVLNGLALHAVQVLQHQCPEAALCHCYSGASLDVLEPFSKWSCKIANSSMNGDICVVNANKY